MVWREAYRPRVLIDVELPVPNPTARILLGAFDLRAQGEIGIWRRLIEDAGSADDLQLFVIGIARTGSGEAVFPPSLHDRIEWIEDPACEWQNLIEPDRPERSFAAVVERGIAKLLVIGPPTEEVWERFGAEISLLRREATPE